MARPSRRMRTLDAWTLEELSGPGSLDGLFNRNRPQVLHTLFDGLEDINTYAWIKLEYFYKIAAVAEGLKAPRRMSRSALKRGADAASEDPADEASNRNTRRKLSSETEPNHEAGASTSPQPESREIKSTEREKVEPTEVDEDASSSDITSSGSDSDVASSSSDDDEQSDDDEEGAYRLTVTPLARRIQKPAFAAGTATSAAELRGRLDSFLPLLRDANAALPPEREAGEKGEAEEGDGEYVEMELGLGVLEEKRGDGEGSSESEDEGGGAEGLERGAVEGGGSAHGGVGNMREHGNEDIMSRLMGRETGKPAGIEEV